MAEFVGDRELDATTLVSELGPDREDAYVELRAELGVLTLSSCGAGVGDVTMMLGIEESETVRLRRYMVKTKELEMMAIMERM